MQGSYQLTGVKPCPLPLFSLVVFVSDICLAGIPFCRNTPVTTGFTFVSALGLAAVAFNMSAPPPTPTTTSPSSTAMNGSHVLVPCQGLNGQGGAGQSPGMADNLLRGSLMRFPSQPVGGRAQHLFSFVYPEITVLVTKQVLSK